MEQGYKSSGYMLELHRTAPLNKTTRLYSTLSTV